MKVSNAQNRQARRRGPGRDITHPFKPSINPDSSDNDGIDGDGDGNGYVNVEMLNVEKFKNAVVDHEVTISILVEQNNVQGKWLKIISTIAVIAWATISFVLYKSQSELYKSQSEFKLFEERLSKLES